MCDMCGEPCDAETTRAVSYGPDVWPLGEPAGTPVVGAICGACDALFETEEDEAC